MKRHLKTIALGLLGLGFIAAVVAFVAGLLIALYFLVFKVRFGWTIPVAALVIGAAYDLGTCINRVNSLPPKR